MKSRDWVFIIIVVGVVGGLYLLSRSSGRAPKMPDNAAHAGVLTRDQCLTCHTPDKMSALEVARKHPLKWHDARISCMQCHQPAAPPQKAINQPAPLETYLSWQKQQ
jgi:hypothetical protein